MPFKISRSFAWFVVAGSLAFLVDVGVLALLRNVLGVYAARVVSFWLAATLIAPGANASANTPNRWS